MILKGSLVKVFLIVIAFIAVFAISISAHSHFSSISSLKNGGARVVATFPAKHHVWIVAHKQVPNVLYHFSEYTQVGISSDPSDPGTGEVIKHDIWLETGSSGTTIFQHDIATLPDGSLYQETFDNSSMSILIRGPGYLPIEGDASNSFWCVSKSAPTADLARFPYYADTTALAQDGFTASSQAVNKPVPQTSVALPGITPIQTLSVPARIHTWQATGVAQEPQYKSQVQIAADNQGRVLTFKLDTFDSSDKRVGTQWYTIGQIDIYSSSAQLPTSIFAVPLAVTKGCHA